MTTFNKDIIDKYYNKLKGKTKPLTIGLDFDNTLVYARQDAIKIAAKELGIKLACSQPRDYNFKDFPDNMKERIYQLFRTPSFSVDLEIIPGTQDKLIEWKRLGHNLIIITARDVPIRPATDEFIKRHFSMVDDIHYVDMLSSKAGKFIDLKLDVWVDDSPVDAPEASKMGIRTCLISNSHTQYNFYLKEDPALKLAVYDNVSSINL